MAITSPIFSMFGRSPLRPLQKHMNKVHEAAESLLPFFDAVLEENWVDAEKRQGNISQLERDADDLKRDLRLHMPKGLFLPVPRSDLLELLAMQDKIANVAEDIAGIVIGRQMRLPNFISESYIIFLNRCIDASKQARKAINELDELLETGFRGSEVKLVEEMITTLDEIERDTDDMQVDIRKKLYHIENQLPPVEAMFLYKMIENTGKLADCAQSVGARLQLLLAR